MLIGLILSTLKEKDCELELLESEVRRQEKDRELKRLASDVKRLQEKDRELKQLESEVRRLKEKDRKTCLSRKPPRCRALVCSSVRTMEVPRSRLLRDRPVRTPLRGPEPQLEPSQEQHQQQVPEVQRKHKPA